MHAWTTAIAVISILFAFFLNHNNQDREMSTRVVVIGGGLAGLSAALEAHAAGALVTLIEKEAKLG